MEKDGKGITFDAKKWRAVNNFLDSVKVSFNDNSMSSYASRNLLVPNSV